MAEVRPTGTKSHHNDSEPQIKESMKDKPPNTAPEAQKPNYVSENGKVVNKLDGSVVAEGEDEEELGRIADHWNRQSPPKEGDRHIGDKRSGAKPDQPGAALSGSGQKS